jgi:hypothetical protein
MVEHIGPQCHHHAQARALVQHRGDQAVQQVRPLGLVQAEREQLLELVDDQEQFGPLIRRKHEPRCPQQPATIGGEQGEKLGRFDAARSDGIERVSQAREGRHTRQQHRDEPLL